MKKLLLLAGLTLGLCSALRSDAQVRVNINVGGPVARQTWYGNDDDYYYMPQQNVYYNVQRRVYVYPERSGWMYAPVLPSRYGNCSYSNSRYYRVRARAPFDRNDYYRQQYAYNNGNGRGNGYGRRDGWNDDNNRNDRRWDDDDNRRGGGYGNRRR